MNATIIETGDTRFKMGSVTRMPPLMSMEALLKGSETVKQCHDENFKLSSTKAGTIHLEFSDRVANQNEQTRKMQRRTIFLQQPPPLSQNETTKSSTKPSRKSNSSKDDKQSAPRSKRSKSSNRKNSANKNAETSNSSTSSSKREVPHSPGKSKASSEFLQFTSNHMKSVSDIETPNQSTSNSKRENTTYSPSILNQEMLDISNDSSNKKRKDNSSLPPKKRSRIDLSNEFINDPTHNLVKSSKYQRIVNINSNKKSSDLLKQNRPRSLSNTREYMESKNINNKFVSLSSSSTTSISSSLTSFTSDDGQTSQNKNNNQDTHLSKKDINVSKNEVVKAIKLTTTDNMTQMISNIKKTCEEHKDESFNKDCNRSKNSTALSNTMERNSKNIDISEANHMKFTPLTINKNENNTPIKIIKNLNSKNHTKFASLPNMNKVPQKIFETNLLNSNYQETNSTEMISLHQIQDTRSLIFSIEEYNELKKAKNSSSEKNSEVIGMIDDKSSTLAEDKGDAEAMKGMEAPEKSNANTKLVTSNNIVTNNLDKQENGVQKYVLQNKVDLKTKKIVGFQETELVPSDNMVYNDSQNNDPETQKTINLQETEQLTSNDMVTNCSKKLDRQENYTSANSKDDLEKPKNVDLPELPNTATDRKVAAVQPFIEETTQVIDVSDSEENYSIGIIETNDPNISKYTDTSSLNSSIQEMEKDSGLSQETEKLTENNILASSREEELLDKIDSLTIENGSLRDVLNIRQKEHVSCVTEICTFNREDATLREPSNKRHHDDNQDVSNDTKRNCENNSDIPIIDIETEDEKTQEVSVYHFHDVMTLKETQTKNLSLLWKFVKEHSKYLTVQQKQEFEILLKYENFDTLLSELIDFLSEIFKQLKNETDPDKLDIRELLELSGTKNLSQCIKKYSFMKESVLKVNQHTGFQLDQICTILSQMYEICTEMKGFLNMNEEEEAEFQTYLKAWEDENKKDKKLSSDIFVQNLLNVEYNLTEINLLKSKLLKNCKKNELKIEEQAVDMEKLSKKTKEIQDELCSQKEAKKELENKMSNVNKDMKKKEGTISTLQCEKENLQTKLDHQSEANKNQSTKLQRIKDAINKLKTKYKKVQTENYELKDLQNEHKLLIDDYIKSNNDLKKEIENEKNLAKENEKNYNDLKEKYESLEIELNLKNSENKIAMEENTKLQKDIQGWKIVRNGNEEKINVLQDNELEHLNKIQALERELNDKIIELGRFESELNSSKSLLSTSQQQYTILEKENKELQTKREQYESELEKLRNKNIDLTKDVTKIQNEIDIKNKEHKNICNEYEDNETKFSELFELKEKLESEILIQNSNIQKMTSDLITKENKITELKNTSKEDKVTINNLNTEVNNLKTFIYKVQVELLEITKKAQEAAEAKIRNETALKEMNEKRKKLLELIESQNKKLHEMSDGNTKLKADIACKNEQINELQQNLISMEQTVSSAKNMHKLIEERCEFLETEMEEIRVSSQGQNQSLTDTLDSYKSQIEAININLIKYENLIKDIRNDKDTLNKQVDGLKTELSSKITEVHELNKSISELFKKYTESKQSYLNKQNIFAKEKYDLQNKLSRLNENNLKLETQYKKLEETFEEKVHEIENLTGTISSKEEIITLKESEIIAFNSDIKEKEVKIADLERRLEKARRFANRMECASLRKQAEEEVRRKEEEKKTKEQLKNLKYIVSFPKQI